MPDGEMIALMQKTLLTLLLMLWIVVGALNAAGQANSGQALKSRNACALVTKAEIDQIIGTSMSNGIPHEDDQADACAFVNPRGYKIGIFISRSQERRDLNTLVSQAKEALPHAKVR